VKSGRDRHVPTSSALNVVSKSTIKRMARAQIFDIFVTARNIQNANVQRKYWELCAIRYRLHLSALVLYNIQELS
jgi:hypothetical protein